MVKLNGWFFVTKEGDYLRKYNDVWKKVNKSIKKGFDSKPIYNKQMLKFKIKCYVDEATG